MSLPAAPLDAMQAESTPIYGQAADTVTAEGIMHDLATEAAAHRTGGCAECKASGYYCLIGSTAVYSGGNRKVYPISIECPPNVCDDCDETAEAVGAR